MELSAAGPGHLPRRVWREAAYQGCSPPAPRCGAGSSSLWAALEVQRCAAAPGLQPTDTSIRDSQQHAQT